MFFWALMLVISSGLWWVETYLRRKDEQEQARLRADATARAAAARRSPLKRS